MTTCSLARLNPISRRLMLGVAAALMVLPLLASGAKAASLDEIKKRGLIVVTEDDFRPFEFVKDGTPTGFDNELIEDLRKYAPFEIKQQILPWTGILAGVSTGKYDVAITAAIITKERKQSLDFTSPIADAVTKGFGSVSSGAFAITFIPFLVYFMLSWQQHVRSATVMLFRMEHRHTAYVTLGLISRMIRSFMVGNLLLGLLMATISVAVFGAIGLPFFFVVGVLSGFLSLVPYLGLALALAPPLLVGLGQTDSGDLFAICVLVLALHFFALNVMYPKFLGNRMQINPLAVTIALLFWGWLWGAMGLILAIPITAAMKIIFDHVESLKPWGAWMGE